jgi:hypothetical protein
MGSDPSSKPRLRKRRIMLANPVHDRPPQMHGADHNPHLARVGQVSEQPVVQPGIDTTRWSRSTNGHSCTEKTPLLPGDTLYAHQLGTSVNNMPLLPDNTLSLTESALRYAVTRRLPVHVGVSLRDGGAADGAGGDGGVAGGAGHDRGGGREAHDRTDRAHDPAWRSARGRG